MHGKPTFGDIQTRPMPDKAPGAEVLWDYILTEGSADSCGTLFISLILISVSRALLFFAVILTLYNYSAYNRCEFEVGVEASAVDMVGEIVWYVRMSGSV